MLFIRDYLTDLNWWDRKATSFKPLEVSEHVKEYEIALRVTISTMLYAGMEEFFRSLIATIDRNNRKDCPKVTADFSKIYKFMLEYCNKTSYAKLINIHAQIRNSIHNNGIYLPKNNDSLEIHYKGKIFKFSVGKKKLIYHQI